MKRIIMNEITDVKCIDGKKHNWKTIHQAYDYGLHRRESWCTRCGSITEFIADKYGFDCKRCKEEKGYYIEIPTFGKRKKRVKKEEEFCDEAYVEI